MISHKPSEKDRKTVESMSAYGIPQDEIALVIGVDPKTLRRHYRVELDTAEARANAKVAESLFRKAIGDGTGSVSAAIFWLKCRAGWKDAVPEGEELPGKKAQARRAAENASKGWGGLLEPGEYTN